MQLRDTFLEYADRRSGERFRDTPSELVMARARRIGLDTAVTGLLVLGAVLRLRPYLANRSLWLDESYLGANVVGREFGRVLGRLQHDQVAPPGFLLGQQLVVDVFGSSEYALRALPVIAAIVALVAFWRLASALLPPGGVVIALAIFAISESLIYFASEAKQYSVDVAVAVTLWWMMSALQPWLDDDRSAAWAALVAVGATAIWLSHPAIFVLGGFVLESSVRNVWSGAWRALAVRIGAGLIWAASFIGLYLTSLRFIDAGLYRGWGRSAAPLVPASFAVVNKYVDAVWVFSTLPLGRQVAPLVTLAAVLGVAALWRRTVRPAAWLTGTLLFAWIASSFGHFPVTTRVWLFFTPAVVLLTAAGVKEVSRRTRHTFPALAPILACLILGYPTITTGRALVQPRMHEEIRPLLVHLRQHYREGDVVYVYPAAQYASQYYARRGLSLPGSV